MRAPLIARSSTTRQAQPAAANHALFGSIELMGASMTLKKGSEIYGQNEPADYVYKLVNGTARSYKVLNDGRRQIQGFYFPGDIFGLEADAEHDASAEAISDVTVLVIRRSAILAAAARDNDVAKQLWAYTSRELQSARDHAMLLVKTAQERVASFLLQLAERGSGNALELPMSRQDIADYLGLTIETVSRTLTQLQEDAAIELPSTRRIVLRNRVALSSLNS